MAVASSLFSSGGGVFVPSPAARGPWDPGALHGGAPAALVAHLLESMPFDGPGRFTRLSVELLRPVPLDHLEVELRVVRAGRQVQWLEAGIDAAGRPVGRVQATRVRTLPGTNDAAPGPDAAPPPPEAGEVRAGPPGSDEGGFATDALELRFVRGEFGVAGPATTWFRFRFPVLDGAAASPFVLAAAVSDFGNGIANALDWNAYTFLNADLDLHLERAPEGEWLASEAITCLAEDGTGVAHARLHDRRGPVGRASQSLLVVPRSG
ncbi:MAG: thioesterase family protein [Actinomycetota bacterium]|nr:thioesterase family protein [Actinomycetota bacterium]